MLPLLGFHVLIVSLVSIAEIFDVNSGYYAD
jgi:hypothetical protein